MTLTELYDNDIKNILKQYDPDVYEYFKRTYKKLTSDNKDCAVTQSEIATPKPDESGFAQS